MVRFSAELTLRIKRDNRVIEITRPVEWSHWHEHCDWIDMAHAILAADRLQLNPEDLSIGLERAMDGLHKTGIYGHAEWVTLIKEHSVIKIVEILLEDSEQGMFRRSNSPFRDIPFVSSQESKKIDQMAFRQFPRWTPEGKEQMVALIQKLDAAAK